MTAHVEPLSVLSCAPCFDTEMAADLLSLVGMDGEATGNYLRDLHATNLTRVLGVVSRVAEPLRTEMRGSLYREHEDVYRQALGMFAAHALNGSGAKVADVLGHRGARLSAHVLACVAEPNSPDHVADLVRVVQERSDRFEADLAADAANLLERYQFGADRRSDFFTGLSLWTRGRKFEASGYFERVLALNVPDKATGISAHLLGVAHYSAGQLGESEELLNVARRVLEDLGDSDGLSMVLTTFGRLKRDQYRLTDDTESLASCRAALEEALGIVPSDSPQEGRVLQALAMILTDTGDPEAISFGERAVTLAKDPVDKVAAMTSLALIYRDFDDLGQSAERLSQAAALALEHEMGGIELARLMNVQAGHERRQQNWDKASSFARTSLAMGRRLKDRRHIAHAAHTLAAIGTDQLEHQHPLDIAVEDVELLLVESRRILAGLRDARGVEMVDRTRRRFRDALHRANETPAANEPGAPH